MNIFIWVIQILLALAFGYSSIMKATQSREKLVSIGQTGMDGLSSGVIKFIGISEIAGAVGIILPWALTIMPILTPVAALCFSTIMILAMPIHYKRKEFKAMAANVLLFVFSIFIAYMRFIELK